MVEHDQRGGRIRAAVHEGLDLAGGEGAVLVIAVGDVNDGGGARLAAGEDLLAGLDYLDGAAALAGEHDSGAGHGAIVLAAEAAADEGDVHVEIGGLEIEGGGHAVLYEASSLLAGPNLHPAVLKRHRHGDMRLHEAVAHAREFIALGGQLEIGLVKLGVEFLLKGRVELLRGLEGVRVEVKLLAVAHLAANGLVGVLFVHAVGHAVEVEALVGLHVLMDDRGAVFIKGLLHVENVGERLVFDLDELAGGLGYLLVEGGDGGDEVAYIAHLAADAVHDEAVGQIAAYGGTVGAVLAGHDAYDAGELFRLGGVEALDNAVRDGAAENLAVQHALGVDVRGVYGLARNFEQGVLAGFALADGIVLCHFFASCSVLSASACGHRDRDVGVGLLGAFGLPALLKHFLGLHDGVNYLRISGAAADISAQHVAYLVLRRVGVVVEQRDGR